MNLDTFLKQHSEFTKPLSPIEIEWKIQGATKDKSKTIVVPYINNRAVMNRLDGCFGAMNWKVEYKHHNYNITKMDRESKIETDSFKLGCVCVLSIKIDGEWISKSDGADMTTIEPFKGSISDSMKRAATQWGLGRDLYDYPKVFVEGNQFFIPDEIQKRLDGLVTAKNEQGFNQEVVVLKLNNK
jgi:hypothetical protein